MKTFAKMSLTLGLACLSLAALSTAPARAAEVQLRP